MTPYPGAADLVTGESWPNLFAVALDAPIVGPASWTDLAPHALPVGTVPVVWIGFGDLGATGSLRVLEGEVAFTLPGDVGPLIVAGLVVGCAETPPWPVALMTVDPPITLVDQGDSVTIPVALVVLGDPSSE